MSSHAVATHLTTHAQTLENLGGVRTSTDRTGLAQTVVLTVSALAYTTKTVTLHNALETLTLRGTNHVYKSSVIEQLYCKSVTQVQFLIKALELSQVTLGGNTSLLKVAHQRSRSILLLSFLETNLNGCIAIFLDGLNLRYHARTYFDNSAWHILALGTENGCHSDFFS